MAGRERLIRNFPLGKLLKEYVCAKQFIFSVNTTHASTVFYRISFAKMAKSPMDYAIWLHRQTGLHLDV